MKRDGNNGQPSLFPDFNGNSFSFSPFRMILTVDLLYVALIILQYIPSSPISSRTFSMNNYWILSEAFSSSIELTLWFFSSFIWFITFIDIYILSYLFICGIKPTWFWWIIFLMCVYMQFMSILLRIFASLFNNDMGL